MSQRKFARKQKKVQKPVKGQAEKNSIVKRQAEVQAMVWYRKEDWDTLKNMFADAHLLPLTYEDWLARAEAMKSQAQAEGDAVIKVYIDPVTFPEWCEKKGLPMNAEARTQLAIEMAQAQSFAM